MKFISIAVVATLCLDWQMGAVYSDKIEAMRVISNAEEDDHPSRKLKKSKKSKKRNEACSPLKCVGDFAAFKAVLDNADTNTYNIFLCPAAEIKFMSALHTASTVSPTSLTITCCGGKNDCVLNGNDMYEPAVTVGDNNMPHDTFLTLDGITLTKAIIFFEYYIGVGSTSTVKVPNSGWTPSVYVPFWGCDDWNVGCY
jgi:hypothetical protein